MLFLASLSNAQIDCVVIEWNNDSTAYSVVNYNYTTMALPVSGLIPGLEVLVKDTPFQKPDYDTRLKLLVTSYSISEDYHTVYTSCRKWVKSYSLLDRSVSEQLISIDDAEQYANLSILPSSKHLKFLAFACTAAWRKANGISNTQREIDFMDVFISKTLKMYKNDVLSEQKKDSLNLGHLVDLDYGWEDEVSE